MLKPLLVLLFLTSLVACSKEALDPKIEQTQSSEDFYKSKPQVLFCTTTIDTLPVVRAMYLSKYQSGTYTYESLPKKLRSPGHSEHFLVSVGSTDAIEFHIPTNPAVFPDCARGTSMSTLKANGQTASFAFD